MSFNKDVAGLLRGIQIVLKHILKQQQKETQRKWQNSSVRLGVKLITEKTCQQTKDVLIVKHPEDLPKMFMEAVERCNTVLYSARKYICDVLPTQNTRNLSFSVGQQSTSSVLRQNRQEKHHEFNEEEVEEDLKKDRKASTSQQKVEIQLTASDRHLLEKLEMQHSDKGSEKLKEKHEQLPKVMPNPKSTQTLSANSKQRKVPSSRLSRMVSFGSLAAGLGFGTATEYARRTFGLSGSNDRPNTLFLTPANLDRIVDTLCKVRGAALKLGQIISIQDDKMISPELAMAMERVRKSADFMPNWQVSNVLSTEFGPQWRRLFVDFEEKPFAAASIGQVHRATIQTDDDPRRQQVAVKIQYPGVAQSIESDLDNLGAILKLWNVFPKGMFLENLMPVAKRELAWEVDYVREAECTRRFRQLLLDEHPEFYVPNVIDHLSTKQVVTTELLHGIPVDQCFEMAMEHRQFIAEQILDLCMLEILKFRYMQTDPNWANFLYDPDRHQILLLDFGASREYSRHFMDQYVRILKAACDGDRATVLSVSRMLGFLTGYESRVMEEAHVDAVMILGEVFRCEGFFDFARQDMTERIQNLVPTMISHRLCPPPEEVYSLHRKLSGVFLLCAKMKVTVACRKRFLQLYEDYTRNTTSDSL